MIPNLDELHHHVDVLPVSRDELLRRSAPYVSGKEPVSLLFLGQDGANEPVMLPGQPWTRVGGDLQLHETNSMLLLALCIYICVSPLVSLPSPRNKTVTRHPGAAAQATLLALATPQQPQSWLPKYPTKAPPDPASPLGS